MSDNFTVEKIELGSHFYLWKPSIDREDGGDQVMITAHGGFRRNNLFQVRPGLELNYYTQHGTMLLSTRGTTLGARYRAGSVEVIHSTATPALQDYILRKFQGRHGNHEDPDDVAETYADVESFVSTFGIAAVMVRNRCGFYKDRRGWRKLSTVYRRLESKFPNKYNRYYCSFCRNLVGGPDPFDNMQIISVTNMGGGRP